MQRKYNHILFLFFLTLTIGILYINSLKNGFFLDDYTQIVENSSVKYPAYTLSHLSNKTTQLSQDIVHFRPLPFFYRVVIYRFFKDNPFYYHFANVILYTCFCFLIYRLFCVLGVSFHVAAISTVLFAVHPHQTSAVDFLAGDGVILYGIFCILMTLYFFKYLQDKSKFLNYFLSILFYLLAILSHDVAYFSLSTIFFIALYAFKYSFKDSLKLSLGYICCAAGYFLIRVLLTPKSLIIIHDNILNSHLGFSLIFFSFLRLVGWYLVEIILPFKFVYMWSLTADHSWILAKALFYLTILVFGLLYAFRIKQDHVKSISILLFLFGFLPVPILMFTYFSAMGLIIEPLWFIFSSTGFFLFLGLHLDYKQGTSLERRIKIYILIFLIIYWGSFTIKYNEVWRSGISYAKYWLKIVPKNPYALRSLGRDYLREKKPSQAISYFNKFLKLGEHYLVYNEIGRAYNMMGKYDQGYMNFKKSFLLQSKDPYSSDQIGFYFYRNHMIKNAQEYFTFALSNDPNFTPSLIHLGDLYFREGQCFIAAGYLSQALDISRVKGVEEKQALEELNFCLQKFNLFK